VINSITIIALQIEVNEMYHDAEIDYHITCKCYLTS